jgi:hypothetical protein
MDMARFGIREFSHQYENDNDNEHVISLWVRASRSWRYLAPFRSTSSSRSKRTWFCWFASICWHFPLANAIPFDYLKNNCWRVRYHYRFRLLVRNLPINEHVQNVKEVMLIGRAGSVIFPGIRYRRRRSGIKMGFKKHHGDINLQVSSKQVTFWPNLVPTLEANGALPTTLRDFMLSFKSTSSHDTRHNIFSSSFSYFQFLRYKCKQRWRHGLNGGYSSGQT